MFKNYNLITLFLIILISNLCFSFEYREIHYENAECSGDPYMVYSTSKCSNYGTIELESENQVVITKRNETDFCGDATPSPTSEPTNSTNSTDSTNNNNEPKIESFALNKCTKIDDKTSIYVTLSQDESPYRLNEYCNTINYANNNCENILIKSFKNNTCIPSEDGIANQFNRLSCRGPYVDIELCIGQCSDAHCNISRTLESNSTFCGTKSIDLYNNSLKLNHNIMFLLLISFAIVFIIF